MARDDDRARHVEDDRAGRAAEAPIVGGLPDVPGIGVAMRLTAGLGVHLRGLADELLVHDYPGATLTRPERELLATAVSASNACFFCMDSHAAHALALIDRMGAFELQPAIEAVKLGSAEGPADGAGAGAKLEALLRISRIVARDARALTEADVRVAIEAGATDGDVQLAVLIAAGFAMYNRLVDGFRARTPADVAAYTSRAGEIAERGYSG